MKKWVRCAPRYEASFREVGTATGGCGVARLFVLLTSSTKSLHRLNWPPSKRHKQKKRVARTKDLRTQTSAFKSIFQPDFEGVLPIIPIGFRFCLVCRSFELDQKIHRICPLPLSLSKGPLPFDCRLASWFPPPDAHPCHDSTTLPILVLRFRSTWLEDPTANVCLGRRTSFFRPIAQARTLFFCPILAIATGFRVAMVVRTKTKTQA